MRSLQAVQMDNIFPDISDVMLRRGSDTWITGANSAIKSLHAYESASGAKLFASTTTKIYDATTTGTFGASVVTCTSGAWSSTNMSTSGGQFLVMVNGVDSMQVYDGSTWNAITGISTPAITGVATTALSYVVQHQRRLWFVKANSMDLYYLPVDSYAGAASVFPVGPLFKKGGKVTAIGTWTVDGGTGSQDFFVIVTSAGELAVYQGTDPADATKWSLVGVYEAGKPVGTRPFADFGGDLLYLSENGLFPVSEFLQSAILDVTKAVNFLVQGAYLPMVEAYKTVAGWQVLAFRRGNFLLINLPVAADTTSVQFVMNLTTKAWCRFLNWNASCFCESGGNLYFAVGTKVYLAWTGTSDSGVTIQGDVIAAYNGFGYGQEKQITLVRPHVSIDGSVSFKLSLDTDFRSYEGSSQVTYTTGTGTGIWGSSLWDGALWSAGTTPLKPTWTTVPCDIGFLHAFRLQILSSSATVSWTATNFLYTPAGVL